MWEDRYKGSDYLYGKAPSQVLRTHEDLLVAGGTALAVADGEGRNSVFMAERGMQVTALDYAPSAIAKARKLAAERGVTVDFRTCDVLAGDWPGTYDLVAGIFIQFVGPEGRRKIFDRIKGATAPGGTALLHGYTPDQVGRGTGGPGRVENMYTETILRAAFVGWEVRDCRAYEADLAAGAGQSGRSALIDFVARKPA
ncbi:SAM-dependent methyltransferase [Mesobacterium pallidum]|uniref:SAM-dependent methyltransferase n=1 Tax=Mesobacterium pallidum TaxID=2872037 RepID=UPI001EE1BE1E|nr:class I SAM-dependent methyltransferase [Mesobacterium pallidum]